VLRKADGSASLCGKRFQASIPRGLTSRAALARLPVLRKPTFRLHKASPPFGGLSPGFPVVRAAVYLARPIFEPEATHADPWRGARALSGRLPPGRRGAEHLQLSPDTGRFHLHAPRAHSAPGDPAVRQYRSASSN